MAVTIKVQDKSEIDALKELSGNGAEAGAGSNLAPLIDELGQIDEEVVNLQASIDETVKKIAQYNARAKELREQLADAAYDSPDESGIKQGQAYIADIGTASRSREVTDKKRLLEILGVEQFLALASFKLGDLDRYLTEPQRDEVIETKRDRTKRTIKTRRKA